MDPFTLALLAQAGAKGIGTIAQGASQYMQGRDLMLTEEQKKRLKELERQEALGQFGLQPDQREAYRAQALTPIQQAERQAMAQFGASQAIGDIGQGAAFRQQQAIKQGSEESRAKIATALAEKEAQAAQQQQAQLEALRAQEMKAQQMQRDAALGALGGLAQAAGEAAGQYAENEAISMLYDKKLAQLTGSEQQTADATRNMLGIGTIAETASLASKEAEEAKDLGETAAEQITTGFTGYDREGVPILKQLKADVIGKKIPVGDTLQAMIGGTYAARPNSKLTREERLDLLGQPPAELPPASGVQELSNVENAAGVEALMPDVDAMLAQQMAQAPQVRFRVNMKGEKMIPETDMQGNLVAITYINAAGKESKYYLNSLPPKAREAIMGDWAAALEGGE